MVRSLSSGVIAASSLAAALVLGASVAQAGGGCRGSACYNLVNTPPVYGSINETYQVRPAQVQRRVVPAEYETVTDNVMIAPELSLIHI